MSSIPYGDVAVVNSDRAALQLALELKKAPIEVQRKSFGGSKDVGFFYLYRDEALQPETVFESVVSEAGDAISSTYKRHTIFNSPQDLARGRAVLIGQLASKIGLPAESIGIEDPARGRTLGLTELSTGQMIDLLAERMGQTVMRTDSHAMQETPEQLADKLMSMASNKPALLNPETPKVLTMKADGSMGLTDA